MDNVSVEAWYPQQQGASVRVYLDGGMKDGEVVEVNDKTQLPINIVFPVKKGLYVYYRLVNSGRNVYYTACGVCEDNASTEASYL